MKTLGTVKRAARQLLSGPPTAPAPTPAQRRILDVEATTSDRRSILFFTTHKCASTFVSKLLHAVEAETDLRHFDYATAAYRLGDAIETGDIEHTDIERVIERNPERLFHPTGEIYGPLRRPVDFPGRADYTQLFFLRDPRDVLVSAYYSFGFSHGVPANAKMQALFMAERQRIQDEGIDRFVLRLAGDWLAPTYRTYDAFRQDGRDTHYLTYDSYKDDPGGFIATLFGLIDIDVPQPVIDSLAMRAQPIQAASGTGGALRHQRSGQTGQFVTELTEDTLKTLDDVLGDVLDAWGFARHAAGA